MIKSTEPIKYPNSTSIEPIDLHHVSVSFISSTNVSRALSEPFYKKQTAGYFTQVPLTCCGLQKQQGEETADRDCTLHDGCQENSDSHTDYIYQGRKVKGHSERRGGAKRGPAGTAGSEPCVWGVGGVIACNRDPVRVQAAGSPVIERSPWGASASQCTEVFQCWITHLLTVTKFVFKIENWF